MDDYINKRRLVEMLNAGYSRREISRQTGIPEKTINRVILDIDYPRK